MARELLPQERALLNAILDELIPRNPARDIPGAGELGLASFLLECAAKDEGFHATMRIVLDRAADGSVKDVRRIEAETPYAFAQLLEQSYKGYYSRADTRVKLGIGAHPPHPEGYEVAPESSKLMKKLTAPVRARGRFYRDAPAGKNNAK